MAFVAPGPRPTTEISRVRVTPTAEAETPEPLISSDPPLNPGLPVLEKPTTAMGPVPSPSCPAAETTKVPCRTVTSPVNVLALLVRTNVPLPIFVRPAVPARIEEIVARLTALTVTSGARMPTGAAKVKVSPVILYSVTPKFRPPTVIASPKLTVPAAPLK